MPAMPSRIARHCPPTRPSIKSTAPSEILNAASARFLTKRDDILRTVSGAVVSPASRERLLAASFERQREDHGRSLGRRLGPHASAMRLHDSPRDVEPEPRSDSFRSLGPPIAIEYVREIFR